MGSHNFLKILILVQATGTLDVAGNNTFYGRTCCLKDILLHSMTQGYILLYIQVSQLNYLRWKSPMEVLPPPIFPVFLSATWFKNKLGFLFDKAYNKIQSLLQHLRCTKWIGWSWIFPFFWVISILGSVQILGKFFLLAVLPIGRKKIIFRDSKASDISSPPSVE